MKKIFISLLILILSISLLSGCSKDGVETFKEENDKLKSQNTELENKNKELEDEISSLKSIIEDNEKEINELKERMDEILEENGNNIEIDLIKSIYEVNDEVDYKGLVFKVEEVYETKSSIFKAIDDTTTQSYANGRYLVLKISITNKNSDEVDLSKFTYSVSKNDGTKFEYLFTAGDVIAHSSNLMKINGGDNLKRDIKSSSNEVGTVFFDVDDIEIDYTLKIQYKDDKGIKINIEL